MTENDDRDATRAQPQWGPDAAGNWPSLRPQQPGYGQPQYGQPQYGQPQWQQEPAPLVAQEPTSHRGRAVGAAVAAVVLIGGGVGTYVAVSSGSDSGAGSASPKAAVQKLVGDLDNSDLIGVLNDLPPGERESIVQPFTDQVNQLKRNDVIATDADPSKISGVDVSSTQLTYAAATLPINDHVQIVQITGGTLTVNADALKLPLTADVLKQDRANSSDTSKTTTYDLADYQRRNGHPLRVAAQKVDGRWYPSLTYTIADLGAPARPLAGAVRRGGRCKLGRRGGA